MAISTRVVKTGPSGAATLHVEPCFYAGGEAGTVTDSLAGSIGGDHSYAYGDMPFVQGELVIQGVANTEYALYFDFSC